MKHLKTNLYQKIPTMADQRFQDAHINEVRDIHADTITTNYYCGHGATIAISSSEISESEKRQLLKRLEKILKRYYIQSYTIVKLPYSDIAFCLETFYMNMYCAFRPGQVLGRDQNAMYQEESANETVPLASTSTPPNISSSQSDLSRLTPVASTSTLAVRHDSDSESDSEAENASDEETEDESENEEKDKKVTFHKFENRE